MELIDEPCEPERLRLAWAAFGALALCLAVANTAVALLVSPVVAMHPMLTLTSGVGGAWALLRVRSNSSECTRMDGPGCAQAARWTGAGLLALITLRFGAAAGAPDTVGRMSIALTEGVVGPYGVWPLGVGAAALLAALCDNGLRARTRTLFVGFMLLLIGGVSLASMSPAPGVAGLR